MDRHIAILGAGRIGRAIANMTLVISPECGVASVSLYDVVKDDNVIGLNCAVQSDVIEALKDKFLVVCALPHSLTLNVAKAAIEVGCHYIDMTEDIYNASRIKELVNDTKAKFIPQSGLAPGVVSIIGHYLLSKLDWQSTLRMRVGALPQTTIGNLRYECTWSPDGLINEYSNLCDVISGGRRTTAEPLDGLERLTIDGVEYEAFNTSGGVGDIHNVRYNGLLEVDYKTLRYPGHRDLMKILMNELQIPHDVLIDSFRYLPIINNDVVVIYIEATGRWNDKKHKITYCRKIFPRHGFTAIQLTTAGSVCGLIEMLLKDQIDAKGIVNPWDIDFGKFVKTTWGKVYS